MGRHVLAEERLHHYLKSYNGNNVYTVGLIIGQSTELKDYVVHLARTAPIVESEVVEEHAHGSSSNGAHDPTEIYIASVKDIDVNLVADHAKHVTRMLPGNVWVLGIFIIGPGDCLNDSSSVQKLKSVLVTIRRNLLTNVFLYGNSAGENLILNYNSVTQKFVCKSVDTTTNGNLKPADWKFQKKITKWNQLEAFIELDYLLPITEDKKPQTLKRQLQNILLKISEMIHSAHVVIEGESRPLDNSVDEIGKQKKRQRRDSERGEEKEEKTKVLQAEFYLPYILQGDKPEVKTILCGASMRLVGQISSRTCVHQKATIGEAVNALKQDVLRSLASRLELHWDSLIDEENGSPEEIATLHEPPRRVLVQLPESKLHLSDYLFPGEGTQESLVLFKELLDIEVQDNQIQKDIELQVDPAEFCSQNDLKPSPADQQKETRANSQLAIYIASLIISFIIAIIAVLVYKLSSQEDY